MNRSDDEDYIFFEDKVMEFAHGVFGFDFNNGADAIRCAASLAAFCLTTLYIVPHLR